MEPMKLFKHKYNTDVAMCPTSVKDFGIGLLIKCFWFNIVNPKNVFCIGTELDWVVVNKEDVANWRIYREQI